MTKPNNKRLRKEVEEEVVLEEMEEDESEDEFNGSDEEEGDEYEMEEDDDNDDADDVDELGESENGDEDQEDVDEEELQQNAKRREDIVDDLSYDYYNLLVCNYHPLNFDSNSSNNSNHSEAFENLLAEQTTRAAQLLYQKLLALPTEPSDVGPVTILPPETSLVPRTRKIPEPKPETKWEKFAREKGIKKRKRERMLYDEETGEYKPRFGYKRIKNGLEDIPIVEVKEGQDPYQDPWQVDRQEKKERIQKNQKNQMKNQLHREKILQKGKGKGGTGKVAKLSFDAAIVPGIPVEFNEQQGKTLKRGKQGLKKALQLVQRSTASMGRYDEMRPGEPSRKLITKTKKNRDNLEPLNQDKRLMKETLRFVSNKKEKKEKGITNSLAAYEGILPDAPELRFKQKKGKGKGKTR